MNQLHQSHAGVLRIGPDGFAPPVVRASAGAPSVLETIRALARAWHPQAWAHVGDSFRHRHDWTGRWYRRGITALKYLVRFACMPVQHERFLALVAADPFMCAYRRRDPRLLERHMHRYINVHWHRRDRLAYLLQHYRFAIAHMPSGLLEQVYAMGHACLGRLTAKDGSLLTLCMRAPIAKGCEGELYLQLCDAHEEPLYSIVFTVADERPTIMIGCVQGPRGEHARDIVRELTRNLHGMRPKQFMLSLVYAFAQHYGIESVVAIGNDAHPLRRAGRALHADYDAFWEEQQGRRIGGGWYALPPSPPRKTLAQVPSSQRAAFRRREALRQAAESLLIGALAPSTGTRVAASNMAGSGHRP